MKDIHKKLLRPMSEDEIEDFIAYMNYIMSGGKPNENIDPAIILPKHLKEYALN